jgi:hypothetical protein
MSSSWQGCLGAAAPQQEPGHINSPRGSDDDDETQQ